MKTVEIDDAVYAQLAARVTGFEQTPNDVLRALLGIDGAAVVPLSKDGRNPLLDFISSNDFKANRDAESKYLAILSWLYRKHKNDFASIERYGKGKRSYFSTSRKKIEADADYAQIKEIPSTPYFAMTTLDNKAKRKVLAHVLTAFGYPRDVIEIVTQQIPSSSRGIDLPDF